MMSVDVTYNLCLTSLRVGMRIPLHALNAIGETMTTLMPRESINQSLPPRQRAISDQSAYRFHSNADDLISLWPELKSLLPNFHMKRKK